MKMSSHTLCSVEDERRQRQRKKVQKFSSPQTFLVILSLLVLGSTCVQSQYLKQQADVEIETPTVEDRLRVQVSVPSSAKPGQRVLVTCSPSGPAKELLALKWLHNTREFYRVSRGLSWPPKDELETQVFPVPGFEVDLDKSSNGSVSLLVASAQAQGNFQCEVTHSGTYETASDSSFMWVVSGSSRVTTATGLIGHIALFFVLRTLWASSIA